MQYHLVLFAQEKVNIVLSQKLSLGQGLLLGKVLYLVLIPAQNFLAYLDLGGIHVSSRVRH
jgi:hypothetical protein